MHDAREKLIRTRHRIPGLSPRIENTLVTIAWSPPGQGRSGNFPAAPWTGALRRLASLRTNASEVCWHSMNWLICPASVQQPHPFYIGWIRPVAEKRHDPDDPAMKGHRHRASADFKPARTAARRRKNFGFRPRSEIHSGFPGYDLPACRQTGESPGVHCVEQIAPTSGTTGEPDLNHAKGVGDGIPFQNSPSAAPRPSARIPATGKRLGQRGGSRHSEATPSTNRRNFVVVPSLGNIPSIPVTHQPADRIPNRGSRGPGPIEHFRRVSESERPRTPCPSRLARFQFWITTAQSPGECTGSTHRPGFGIRQSRETPPLSVGLGALAPGIGEAKRDRGRLPHRLQQFHSGRAGSLPSTFVIHTGRLPFSRSADSRAPQSCD